MPKMQPRVLEKLEWPVLLGRLAEHGQTDDGKRLLLGLSPTMTREQIEEQWGLLDPLRALASHGYRAPIGELHDL